MAELETRSPSNGRTSAVSRILVNKAAEWLMEESLADADLETIVRGCCERLHGAGLPLARVQFSFSVLHPLYRAVGYVWRRSTGLQIEAYRHVISSDGTDRFRLSPYYHMLQHGLEHMRRRLDADSETEFPIFTELRREGLTDYLAFISNFHRGRRQGMLGSWSTSRPSGFTDEEIEALIAVQGRLAVACKMAVRDHVAKNALATYLGQSAGERVLAGQIKRGDGETVRAAIVWGDLRNSTQMAEQLGRQAYIDNLNCFFDNVASAFSDAGGEILSFLGDGFLVAFPCGRNHKESAEACERALAAAIEAERRMAEANSERGAVGNPSLRYGLGLHIGNVMFGNVGLADRLAFSVFGSAVNEAARLEGLTKKFAKPIVASETFVGYCGGAWDSLGHESLRGVENPMAVFCPASENLSVRLADIERRDRAQRLSDAENVVLLHQDSPPGAG
ncbi:MAG: adenylate/guanylate cyclase domain-containing protein [Alphaproteobacteria bacterium]